MIGVQSYGLSHILKNNPEEAFKKLSEIGFETLEPMLVLEERLGTAEICYSNHHHFNHLYELTQVFPVRIDSVHVSPHIDANLHGEILPVSAFTDHLLQLHQRFSITEFVVSSKFSSIENAIFWGKYLAEAADMLSDTPCRLLYHNHDSEMRFVPRGNSQVPLLDYFMDASDEQILLELDIGWAGMVTDEVEIAKRYAKYIYTLHFKDFVPGSRRRFTCETIKTECFAPSGTGEIRTAEVIGMRVMLPHFCGKGIIEQNASVGDIFKDLEIGYQTIRGMLECTGCIRK